jgi:reverse gyrase
MRLGWNRLASLTLPTGIGLAALVLAFSVSAAKAQTPSYSTVPVTTGTTHTLTNWSSFTIEQLLDQISQLQKKKVELDRQQKEIEVVLTAKIRNQQELFKRYGLNDLANTGAGGSQGNSR